MKPVSAACNPPARPAVDGGQHEGRGAHRQRADADAARGRRRRCRRLHGKAERTSREIVEADKREHAETTGQ